MANVFVVYHSGFGHTKLQAEAVHRGAASVEGIKAEIRTSEEASANLDELDQADAIIFGCPTYMGNISAEMKKFIEIAAKKWFTLSWKDKIAGWLYQLEQFLGRQTQHAYWTGDQRDATRDDLCRNGNAAFGESPGRFSTKLGARSGSVKPSWFVYRCDVREFPDSGAERAASRRYSDGGALRKACGGNHRTLG